GAIETTIAPLSNIYHRIEFVDAGRIGGDGRDGDILFSHALDLRGIVIEGVAIAEEDNVLNAGLGMQENRFGILEIGIVAIRVGGRHGIDIGIDAGFVSDILHGNAEIAIGSGDPNLIAGGQEINDAFGSLLGDIDRDIAFQAFDDENN